MRDDQDYFKQHSQEEVTYVIIDYRVKSLPSYLWHQLPDKRNNLRRASCWNGLFPSSRNLEIHVRAYFVTWWRWLRCELATWLDHAVPIRECKRIVLSRALLHTARMWFGWFWAVIITDLLRLNSWFARKRHGDGIVSEYPERRWSVIVMMYTASTGQS